MASFTFWYRQIGWRKSSQFHHSCKKKFWKDSSCVIDTSKQDHTSFSQRQCWMFDIRFLRQIWCTSCYHWFTQKRVISRIPCGPLWWRSCFVTTETKLRKRSVSRLGFFPVTMPRALSVTPNAWCDSYWKRVTNRFDRAESECFQNCVLVLVSFGWFLSVDWFSASKTVSSVFSRGNCRAKSPSTTIEIVVPPKTALCSHYAVFDSRSWTSASQSHSPHCYNATEQ